MSWIVVDLGFGDAGKGLVTDALVRRTGARLVVRYNGGAQAGHNVVSGTLHHTFAQLGAGSFAGARTWLGPQVIVHPTALLAELRIFATKAPVPEISIAAEARVITPWHQALNRARERARGAGRHGSCGVGVGETVRDSLAFPPIRAGHLGDRSLRERADAVRRRLVPEVEALGPEELGAFAPEVTTRWVDAVRPVAAWVRPTEALREELRREDAVFEGAQGVLLDEEAGFHPHTTWSDCTVAHARALVPDAEVVGVTRAWMVRHGAGPLPSADPTLTLDDHNRLNEWQGAVRYGHFDPVLLRYALAVQPVDRLVVTHLDGLRRQAWRCVEAWEPAVELARGDLVHQEQLGVAVSAARVRLGAPIQDEGRVIGAIEAVLGRRVDGVSQGPRAEDLHWRSGGLAGKK